MSILSFVKGLLPQFKSNIVAEDFRTLIDELNRDLVPAYTSANNLLRRKALASAYGAALEQRIQKEVPGMRGLGAMEATRRVFMNAAENMRWLESKFDDLFGPYVTKESMTYRRAVTLAYLDQVRFAVRYANRSLDRILANEVAILLNRPDTQDRHLTSHDKDWFAKNNNSYLIALKSLNIRLLEFREQFEKLPEAVVNESSIGMFSSQMGFSNIDMTGSFNLIYHVRMAIAEWQVKRHRQREEEKRMIELRLLQLKEAMAGKDDPKLQQAIEYNEARLQTLNAQIEDIENAYAS